MESEKVLKKEEGRKEHPDRDADGSRGYRVCGVPLGLIAAHNLPYSRSALNARVERPVADYAMHLASAETEIAKLAADTSQAARAGGREKGGFANGVLEFPRFALRAVHVRREPTLVANECHSTASCFGLSASTRASRLSRIVSLMIGVTPIRLHFTRNVPLHPSPLVVA